MKETVSGTISRRMASLLLPLPPSHTAAILTYDSQSSHFGSRLSRVSRASRVTVQHGDFPKGGSYTQRR